MAGEVTLNSMKICELGEYISKFLHDNGINVENDLVIKVDKNTLRKIDEDIYYRKKLEGSEFIPSDKEVMVTFENLNMIFVADEKTEEK